jgi:hypothetical protein
MFRLYRELGAPKVTRYCLKTVVDKEIAEGSAIFFAVDAQEVAWEEGATCYKPIG